MAATLAQRLQYDKPYWPPFLLRGPETATLSFAQGRKTVVGLRHVVHQEIRIQYKALDERKGEAHKTWIDASRPEVSRKVGTACSFLSFCFCNMRTTIKLLDAGARDRMFEINPSRDDVKHTAAIQTSMPTSYVGELSSEGSPCVKVGVAECQF